MHGGSGEERDDAVERDDAGAAGVGVQIVRVDEHGSNPGRECALDVGGRGVADVDRCFGRHLERFEREVEDGRVGLGNPHDTGVEHDVYLDAGTRADLTDAVAPELFLDGPIGVRHDPEPHAPVGDRLERVPCAGDLAGPDTTPAELGQQYLGRFVEALIGDAAHVCVRPVVRVPDAGAVAVVAEWPAVAERRDPGEVGTVEIPGVGLDVEMGERAEHSGVIRKVEHSADIEEDCFDLGHRNILVASVRPTHIASGPQEGRWYRDRDGDTAESTRVMEFRRINALPPYVFATIDALKMESRRSGIDVVDLGFGNPDLPPSDLAIDKLCEAVRNPRNHRYSASRGIPKLRLAITDLYRRKFGVELDPETQACTTIGAKEGFSHLMWVLLGPGDAAMVPSPSYPIHIWGPLFAGAEIRHVRLGGEHDFFENLLEAWEDSWPRPKVIVLSFPHNPTTACVDLAFMERMVNFAREHEVLLVHDFAYADLGFDGYDPPSILQVPGAEDVAVELYTMTKSFSMAGWRMGFLLGNAEVVAALAKLKSYLDYGTFQPVQIAATVAMNETPDFPLEVNAIYRSRRDALIDGLGRAGWEIEAPKGTMFVWAPIPPAYEDLGSLEFAKLLVREAQVAVSPGMGFGPGGEGHVRFALVENEQRIGQATRNIKRALTRLGAPS